MSDSEAEADPPSSKAVDPIAPAAPGKPPPPAAAPAVASAAQTAPAPAAAGILWKKTKRKIAERYCRVVSVIDDDIESPALPILEGQPTATDIVRVSPRFWQLRKDLQEKKSCAIFMPIRTERSRRTIPPPSSKSTRQHPSLPPRTWSFSTGIWAGLIPPIMPKPFSTNCSRKAASASC